MTDNTLTQEDIAQLLGDAGCPEEFTQQFLATMNTEDVRSQLHLLRGQRRRQLERLHEEGKKLDLLDFLRYKLEKQLPQPEKRKRKGA